MAPDCVACLWYVVCAQAAEKEANARYQLWKSLYDFMEKSHNWTEDPILDEAGEQTLKIEAIRSEVDEYGMRAYKMAKANKDDKVVERLKECIEDFKQVRRRAPPALHAHVCVCLWSSRVCTTYTLRQAHGWMDALTL